MSKSRCTVDGMFAESSVTLTAVLGWEWSGRGKISFKVANLTASQIDLEENGTLSLSLLTRTERAPTRGGNPVGMSFAQGLPVRDLTGARPAAAPAFQARFRVASIHDHFRTD